MSASVGLVKSATGAARPKLQSLILFAYAECLDADQLVRTCDLEPNRSFLIMFASAFSSMLMLGYK